MTIQDRNRCPWCGDDPLYVRYHDEEWGRPIHDDSTLFEFLTLEGAQAGLSWITVLRKREHYRTHFHNWDIAQIAHMSDAALEQILIDPGVIRNRLKIYSVRKNARVALEIQKEFGSLDAYFWDYPWLRHPERSEGSRKIQELVDSSLFAQNDGNKGGKSFPLVNHPATLSELPSETEISKALSKDLRKRGMNFIGSTIIYAYMQAVGMVDDHLESCFRKNQIQ